MSSIIIVYNKCILIENGTKESPVQSVKEREKGKGKGKGKEKEKEKEKGTRKGKGRTEISS